MSQYISSLPSLALDHLLSVYLDKNRSKLAYGEVYLAYLPIFTQLMYLTDINCDFATV